MKNILLITTGCFATALLTCVKADAQISPKAIPSSIVANPWMETDLLNPAELAAEMKGTTTTTSFIFNIGAVDDIKGAKHIGPVSKPENMNSLVSAVFPLPKSAAIVIYCGCCPFVKCPNIRPAFEQFKKNGV